MRLLAVTSPDTLPDACALVRSWREVGAPGSPATVVLTHGRHTRTQVDDVDIRTTATLGIADELLGRLRLALGPDELAWALAPFAIMDALRGASPIMFVRPGGLFLSAATPELAEMAQGPVNLFRLRTRSGGATSTQAVGEALADPFTFLSFGLFTKESRSWLEDWCSAVSQLAFEIAPGDVRLNRAVFRGLLLDERIHWHSNPRIDASAWNIDERCVHPSSTGLFINGEPGCFLRVRELLDRRLTERLSTDPSSSASEFLGGIGRLDSVCQAYQSSVAEYAAQLPAMPPSDLVLSDSTVFNAQMRACYAAYLRDTQLTADPPPPSIVDDEDEHFLNWAKTRIGPETDVTHWMVACWLVRPDLQAAVRDPLGIGNEYLAAWARTHGTAEGYVPQQWLPARPTHRAARRLSKPNRAGCNLFGYVGSDLGLGQLARNLARAVEVYDPQLDVVASRRNSSPAHMGRTAIAPSVQGTGDINLIVVNPDQFQRWLVDVGPSQLASRYNIGVWAWELEEVPAQFHKALEYVDEVWAISTFVRDAINAATDKPVMTLPVPVAAGDRVSGDTLPELDRLGGDDYFLFAFDFLSDYERKNPEAVLRAHQLAFEDSGPWLVIKCMNARKRPLQAARLRGLAHDRRRVLILERALPEEELALLIHSSLGFVSLHRSEGFGLTIAESMARSKPAVATAYSGNLDFMTSQNSFLVPYTMSRIPENSAYSSDGKWAEPDLGVAAHYMRYIVEHPDESATVAARGRRTITDLYSFEAAADFVGQRLDHLRPAIRSRRSAFRRLLRRLPH